MAGKYYGVYGGREGSRVYDSWDRAKANVSGVRGVRYKGFATMEEALEFIDGGGDYGVAPEKKSSSKVVKTSVDREEKSRENPSGLLAYVDGSYKEGKKCWGWGMVLIEDGEIVMEDYGSGSGEDTVSMRNVAGEVEASMKAMQYALDNGYESVSIFYDYMGVECWATGKWKRNNHLTKGYHEFFRNIRDRLDVTFYKVKGHSGDIYNDMADQLAKKAVDEHLF